MKPFISYLYVDRELSIHMYYKEEPSEKQEKEIHALETYVRIW